jgi:hypothetical protein
MNTHDTRQAMAEIDKAVAVLEGNIATLTAERERALLDGDAGLVRKIENGFDLSEGIPAGVTPGLPGLLRAQTDLSALRERRRLLAAQLPSEAEQQAVVANAKAQAEDIATRTAALDGKMPALHAAAQTLAQVALEVADEQLRVWRDAAALDALCRESGILKPPTPDLTILRLPGARALAVVLAHFTGGRPAPVDAGVRRELEAIV